MLTTTPAAPIEAIVFDCDGTLSHIEGIDELANANGVGEQVTQLTAQAMGQVGMNPELYEQRLNWVLPTAQQVTGLIRTYFQHQTPDLLPVLQILRRLGKSIYIVSAGISTAVVGFGELLAVEKANIFAVDVFFDNNGNYLDFDRQSPLVYANGKRAIVQQLKQKHTQIAFVGDGSNDLVVADLVTRFIGYGGAYYREHIKQSCSYYIAEPSMAPLLSFCLTRAELAQLNRKTPESMQLRTPNASNGTQ